MRSSKFALILVGCLVAGSTPALAADKVVKMRDVEFAPKLVVVAMGNSVRWLNEGDLIHTTTSKQAYPSPWDKSLNSDRSWSKLFAFAGAFGYYCRPHSDGMTGMVGKVQVPVKVSPSSGGNSVTFVVRIADAVPPDRWAMQVQRKINGGDWKLFKDRIARKAFNYRSSKDGTHRFRARLVRADLSVVHGWSPIAAARIS